MTITPLCPFPCDLTPLLSRGNICSDFLHNGLVSPITELHTSGTTQYSCIRLLSLNVMCFRFNHIVSLSVFFLISLVFLSGQFSSAPSYEYTSLFSQLWTPRLFSGLWLVCIRLLLTFAYELFYGFIFPFFLGKFEPTIFYETSDTGEAVKNQVKVTLL